MKDFIFNDKKASEYCIKDVEMTYELSEMWKRGNANPRRFTNSVAIIRTRKGSTAGCHMISTYNYRKIMPTQFCYNGYCGQYFEITENVGGQIIIFVYDKLPHSGIEYKNVIKINNVVAIELMSEHEE